MSIDIKDGDVFRWYYKNDAEYRAKHYGSGTAYWCMDNQCYATERSGVIYLIDTYWHSFNDEYLGSETHYVDVDKVDLEFVCNMKDVETIQKYEIEDYDKVYNLSRQKGCYPMYAIDKDAQPSKTAILKKLQRKLEKAESDKRSAEYSIEWIKKQIDEVGG